jgi:hypothetical protein
MRLLHRKRELKVTGKENSRGKNERENRREGFRVPMWEGFPVLTKLIQQRS